MSKHIGRSFLAFLLTATLLISANRPAHAFFFSFSSEPDLSSTEGVAAVLRTQNARLVDVPRHVGGAVVAIGEDGQGRLVRFVLAARNGRVLHSAYVEPASPNESFERPVRKSLSRTASVPAGLSKLDKATRSAQKSSKIAKMRISAPHNSNTTAPSKVSTAAIDHPALNKETPQDTNVPRSTDQALPEAGIPTQAKTSSSAAEVLNVDPTPTGIVASPISDPETATTAIALNAAPPVVQKASPAGSAVANPSPSEELAKPAPDSGVGNKLAAIAYCVGVENAYLARLGKYVKSDPKDQSGQQQFAEIERKVRRLTSFVETNATTSNDATADARQARENGTLDTEQCSAAIGVCLQSIASSEKELAKCVSPGPACQRTRACETLDVPS